VNIRRLTPYFDRSPSGSAWHSPYSNTPVVKQKIISTTSTRLVGLQGGPVVRLPLTSSPGSNNWTSWGSWPATNVSDDWAILWKEERGVEVAKRLDFLLRNNSISTVYTSLGHQPVSQERQCRSLVLPNEARYEIRALSFFVSGGFWFMCFRWHGLRARMEARRGGDFICT
jgi:hypothetical protein